MMGYTKMARLDYVLLAIVLDRTAYVLLGG